MPLPRRILPLPQIAMLTTMPTMRPRDIHGWPVEAPRTWKKALSSFPVVDLGLIFGGLATTSRSVSSIDVRDGTMGDPDGAASQYLRFCTGFWLATEDGGDGNQSTHILVIDDNPFSVPYVDAVCGSYPALPQNAIDPSEANLLLIVFADLNPDALCRS